MMQHHLMVVAAGAATHFAAGWILNSDMLLGKIWKKESKDKKACHGFSKDMRINLGAQAVASVVLAVATCVAISLFAKSQSPMLAKGALEKIAGMFFSQEHAIKNMMHSMYTVLFVWAGFVLPMSGQEVIWCGKDLKHWMLESASDVVCLMALAAMVTYLA
ncbi:MAG: DUF1761 family protein [Candidatus Chromulinivorax sp.]|nr:DUF1761 family protein [Candidatus Chromulinivorax sp.]